MSIQNARSNTSGHVPASVPNDGQLFIQQADDIIYTRKPDGSFRQTLLPKRATAADAPYTVKRWDTYVGVSALTSPRQIALPPAALYPPGQPLVVADESGNCSAANQITLVPNSSDTINGAVSAPQTTANFGVMLFSDGASKWTMVQFTANNSAALAAAVTAAQNAQTAAQQAVATIAQYRLTWVQANQLFLSRFNGNLIFINGQPRMIPSGGVTLSNAGLLSGTLYFVYAYYSNVTNNVALVANTAPPSTDPTYGIQVCSSDATATLVGMTFTGSGSPGIFQAALTRGWANDPGVALNVAVNANTSSSSATGLQQVQFLAWFDECVDLSLEGNATPSASSAGFYAFAQISLDTGAVGAVTKAGGQQFVHGALASRWVGIPGATGLRYAQAAGWVTNGASATFVLNISVRIASR